ncbi:MAG TPA: hypothetical protein VKC63_09545 [Solirubrobacterales bacterium]|nr:hypothetical protein [Solirubrobacterales bacterium]
MRLRIRASETRVTGAERRLTRTLRFSEGLNLVRAENNMGKTTVLMTILYALGWEGMLGPGRTVPFTPAVTSEIDDGEHREAVLESSAITELAGAGGEVMTVQRAIRSEHERRELVHTWNGSVLSEAESAHERRDYYVREKGAARNEAGFHHRLAELIGWDLPEVASWDGSSVLLYTEVIAPLLFVEQTRGWSWIASVMPRYLRLRDPEQRATEFLLSLDSLTRAAERDILVARREEGYDDAIRLRDFGSTQALAVDQGSCPTCDQPLPTTLLGVEIGPVMTLEENRALIDGELLTFKAMRDDAREVLLASRQRLGALRGELNETRRSIRSLKGALTQNGEAPSQAAIARQVRLADRIEELEGLEQALAAVGEDLGKRASEYREVNAALQKIGARGTLTEGDEAKLEAFAELLREQLGEYGFSSVPPEEIELAPDNYQPMRAGSPLRPEKLSASDRVRMVWAYLVGLLEMARRFETAHPGLLVLDEPGQQEVREESLAALFRRLARSAEYNQQVIVATSKSGAAIASMLNGAEASLTEIEGYALKPTG